MSSAESTFIAMAFSMASSRAVFGAAAFGTSPGVGVVFGSCASSPRAAVGRPGKWPWVTSKAAVAASSSAPRAPPVVSAPKRAKTRLYDVGELVRQERRTVASRRLKADLIDVDGAGLEDGARAGLSPSGGGVVEPHRDALRLKAESGREALHERVRRVTHRTGAVPRRIALRR